MNIFCNYSSSERGGEVITLNTKNPSLEFGREYKKKILKRYELQFIS